jgi:hypothetical protein
MAAPARLLTAILCFAGVPFGGVAFAADSHYDPLQTFAPLTLPQPVNRYRSADGSPGPDYWQNRPDYEIHAMLDTALKQLSATETIVPRPWWPSRSIRIM